MMTLVLNANGQPAVLTQHNDNGRTGQNTAETILNTSNVIAGTFGKLFGMPVQGQIYAQPLYVPNVTVNGVVHNVVIVATELDNVYAFDADSAGSPLWTASMLDTAHGASQGETATSMIAALGCNNLIPYVGITSTPVIDPVSGTIYLVAKSVTTTSTYVQRLHALDLATGMEKPHGPAAIAATVSGTGDGSDGHGNLAFDPLRHLNRPGLLLQDGSVFIAFSSHCDLSPSHGWVFAYNASTLAQEGVFVTTPNGGLGGFWMSGGGIAADAGGHIYIASANGSYDSSNVPATELSESILKLGTSQGSLNLVDYFTPSNQACLTTNDADLGAGGVLVLPDQPGTYPHILVAAGKQGEVYVVNRDQLTANNNHYDSITGCNARDPQILEESPALKGMFSVPAYWKNALYYAAGSDNLKMVPLVNGIPNFSQVTTSTFSLPWPGATPSISSNGDTPGTGILWVTNTNQYGPPHPTLGPAILYAFDATNINTELWDSSQAANNRDTADNAVKFSTPTVVNGKVYLGGNSSVTVYGLLHAPAALTSPLPGGKLAGTSALFSWTAGAGVTSYQIWLGTTGVGSNNVYNSGRVASTTANVSGLPINGVKLYVRLWSLIGGSWLSNDYVYTEAGSPALAALTTPSLARALPGASATFSWTAGAGPTQFELWLGTAGIGSSDVFNSGVLGSATTSVNVNGIPTNGVNLYARMWSWLNGGWQSVDYIYTQAGTPAPAMLTSPSPGSTLSGANATFSWMRGSGPLQYELWLGTTGVGSSNIFNSGELSAATTSVNVSALPTNGVTLYARMWSWINFGWQSNDYTFTEAGTPSQASLTAPAPGSKLAGSSQTFAWTAGSGPAQFELWLGTTGIGSSDLFNSGATTSLSANVSGLPKSGVVIYVRLWSMMNSRWLSADYTITEAGTIALPTLTSPAPNTQLPGANVTFSWTSGTGPVAYELWLGTTAPGSNNLYNSGSVTATSANVSGLPGGGVRIYARLWSLINNAWQSTDYNFTSAP